MEDSHAIESFVSFNGTPFSDLLALEAIRLISRSLPIAYSKGENLSARYDMSFAALLGGMSIASGRLGAVHALAYPIGTEFDQNHGRSNGIILPPRRRIQRHREFKEIWDHCQKHRGECPGSQYYGSRLKKRRCGEKTFGSHSYFLSPQGLRDP